MKKTFQLAPAGKHPERHLEAVKHEIRKYIKRERAKPLPTGVDFWDFDCRFGSDAASAQTVHLNDITEQINAVVATDGAQFYVEILAKARVRTSKAKSNESGLT